MSIGQKSTINRRYVRSSFTWRSHATDLYFRTIFPTSKYIEEHNVFRIFEAKGLV